MSQTTRFLQAAFFVSSWMALGWCFHLDPYAYLVLGIPLCIVFQLYGCRRPLSSCWVRETSKLHLDLIGVAMTLALLIVPAWLLVTEWQGANWGVRLYFLAALPGAVGVAFALRNFTASAARSLLLCLATAGVLGCAMMLLVALAEPHKRPFTLAQAPFAIGQFLALLPVCFVMEEVAFRGVLDSHIQHPQDARRWISGTIIVARDGEWRLGNIRNMGRVRILFVRKSVGRSLVLENRFYSMTAKEQETLFRRWLDEHLGLMLKVVRACTIMPEDRDDLFQEILLQLWSSIPAFRGDAKETTWIYRVAFNTALVWRRGEKRRRLKHETLLRISPPDIPPGPVQESGDEQIVELLYAAIRQLPKADASLALMHLDGLSYREMSEVLGISENYVGVKLNRIRAQLAEQLKGATNEL